MKIFKSFFLPLITVLLVIGCSSSDSPSDDNPENPDSGILNPLIAYQELNISYGNDQNQVFDLYLPANRTANTKTVVLVHGGGWTSGDKSSMNPFRDLIQLDFSNLAIVNINYRLADDNNPPYPMQIDDITTIINHLKANKERYTISESYGFIGTSAGAHLSLLWSYAFDTENNIDMASSIVGPTNFTDPAYLENTDPALQEFLDIYGVDPTLAFLEEVSPYHQVKASSPPSILFYGGQDPLIPTTQGTDMRDKLVDLNVTHEFTLYENEGHGWVGANLLDTWFKLKAFMQVHL